MAMKEKQKQRLCEPFDPSPNPLTYQHIPLLFRDCTLTLLFDISQVLTVPMVSVLKNIGPILITLVESFSEGTRLSKATLAAMTMMVISSAIAGYNDLKFDLDGYIAMFFNVVTNLIHVNLTKRIQKVGGIKKEVVLHYQSVFMCFFLVPLIYKEDVPAILKKYVIDPVLNPCIHPLVHSRTSTYQPFHPLHASILFF